MKTLHCPKCGFVTDASGLADDADLRCLECGFLYAVGDGNIWNATTTEAFANVAKYLYGLIDFHQLHPARFKNAIVRAFVDLGWAGPEILVPGNNRIDGVVEMTDKVREKHETAHNFPSNRVTKG